MSTDRCKHGVEMSSICDQCGDERAEQGECSLAQAPGSAFRPKNMAMTDEQIRARLNAIRKTSDSLHGGGYSYESGAPSEACWDIRFLLAHVDGLYARVEDLAARITPNQQVSDANENNH